MYKRILLSEDEKQRIKNLYSLSEQKNPLDVVLQSALDYLEKKKRGEIDDEDKDESEKEEDDKTQYTSDADSSDFISITKKIIDKFEGGYWNPECAKYPGSKHPAKTGMYSRSGETMFGLDREAGKIENTSSEGREFFSVIDNEKEKLGMEKFCSKWTWNYKGGELKDKLMDLAARTMQKLYEKNANSFFKGKTKEIVEKSRPLILHFSYATWNGPGFFKDFAQSINKAVSEGKSMSELIQIAKNDRDRRFGGGAWSKANEKVKNAIDQEANKIV